MTPEETLVSARRRVADRHNSLLHATILRGDWDGGSLVQAAVRAVQEGPKPGYHEAANAS